MKQILMDWRKRWGESPRARLAALYMALITIVTLGVWAVTLPSRDRMRSAFEVTTYYFLWILVIAWLGVIARILREAKPDWKAFAKKNAAGAALSIALVTGVFFSCHPYLRVLADEANLVDVSRVMTYNKKVAQSTVGVYYYRNYNPTRLESPPKKAALFPFVISLVHSATGVRLENAYAVNFAVLAAILFLVFFCIRRIFGAVWAIGTVFLVAAQPVVTQSATSAGFDLFSALVFMINGIGLWMYLKKPSPERLVFVTLNLLLLANARQECVLFIPIVAALLVIRRAVRLEDLVGRGAWAFYAAVPLLATPVIWQRLLVARLDPFESEGLPGFAIKHFINNNLIFLKTLGHFSYFLPYATLVNIVAVLGLIVAADRIIAGALKLEKRQADFAWIAGACLGVYWAIFTAYFRGMMDHPSNSRYYTLFFILLSVAASVFLRLARIARVRLSAAAFLILAVSVFFVYQSQTAEDRFSRTQSLPREYVFVRDFMQRVEKEKGKNFLIAAERPGLFTIHDWGAIPVTQLNRDQLYTDNWRMNLFDDIYVVQQIDSKGKASDVTKLDPRFVLEPLASLENLADSYMQISRVKDITSDAPQKETQPYLVVGPDTIPPPGMTLSKTRIRTRVYTDVSTHK